eukprot:gb/GECG01002747.1/.p1 GENE.gb/GECG01002747.1/~~gb/GECG01002747.1/.p1  ORF type:complete len:517 (+),score=84.01 gb/GECG01002747.1/:1-1551(+)
MQLGKKIGHEDARGCHYLALAFPPENYCYGTSHGEGLCAVEFCSSPMDEDDSLYSAKIRVADNKVTKINTLREKGETKATLECSLVIQPTCGLKTHSLALNHTERTSERAESSSGQAHAEYSTTVVPETVISHTQRYMPPEDTTPIPKTAPPEPHREPSLPESSPAGSKSARYSCTKEDVETLGGGRSYGGISEHEQETQQQLESTDTETATDADLVDHEAGISENHTQGGKSESDSWLPYRFSYSRDITTEVEEDDITDASSSISEQSSDAALMAVPSIPEMSMLESGSQSPNEQEDDGERWLPEAVSKPPRSSIHAASGPIEKQPPSRHDDRRNNTLEVSMINLLKGYEENEELSEHETFVYQKSYHCSRYADSMTSHSTFLKGEEDAQQDWYFLQEHVQIPHAQETSRPHVETEETPLPQYPPSPHPPSEVSETPLSSVSQRSTSSSAQRSRRIAHSPLRYNPPDSKAKGRQNPGNRNGSPIGQQLDEQKQALRENRARSAQELADLTKLAFD